MDNAVEHIRVANGHPGLLFCHPQLTGVLFPAAQNLDFLIAGKLNVGNDILWILEHHHGIQHRLIHIYHDRQPPVTGRGRCLLPSLLVWTTYSANAICSFEILAYSLMARLKVLSGYA